MFQKKNVAEKADLRLWAPWKNGPYKTNPVNTELRTDDLFVCVCKFNVCINKKDLSNKCCVTALERSMTFIGRLNQFSAAANVTHIWTSIWKEKNALTLPT